MVVPLVVLNVESVNWQRTRILIHVLALSMTFESHVTKYLLGPNARLGVPEEFTAGGAPLLLGCSKYAQGVEEVVGSAPPESLRSA